MKPLLRVPAGDLPAFTAQLRQALFFEAGAPAVLPVAGAEEPASEQLVAGFVPDDIAVVVETSGSTDAPKRVMLTGAALRASAFATERWFGGTHGQWLLALPATYIAGIQVLVRSLVAGTAPAVMPEGGFTPKAFVETARTMDPDLPWFTSLVPVQLARLVEAAADDRGVRAALGSFEAILLGGQAAPAGLVERAAELGARVHRTYGSSETAGGCVYDGRALPGVGVRIVDGEVQLSGPSLATGYLDDSDRTARAFTADADGTRWYRTGDLGELVPDPDPEPAPELGPGRTWPDRLRITGRADDVIISGGVKVALGEVERAVRSVAGYAGAVVLPVADAEWGERPAVVVERADAAASVGRSAPSETPASDDLAGLAAATDAAGLPPAGRPVRLLVLERMPLLASGKPDRRAIAAQLAE
ncbi:AMP-binding protein [Agromyces sp. NPDC058110]|uniref:AMP-binding protein n=1 Tax=Agromyces sp. NPDC058110 TaxID=3346345 RepID=UPI0036DE5BD3